MKSCPLSVVSCPLWMAVVRLMKGEERRGGRLRRTGEREQFSIERLMGLLLFFAPVNKALRDFDINLRTTDKPA